MLPMSSNLLYLIRIYKRRRFWHMTEYMECKRSARIKNYTMKCFTNWSLDMGFNTYHRPAFCDQAVVTGNPQGRKRPEGIDWDIWCDQAGRGSNIGSAEVTTCPTEGGIDCRVYHKLFKKAPPRRFAQFFNKSLHLGQW